MINTRVFLPAFIAMVCIQILDVTATPIDLEDIKSGVMGAASDKLEGIKLAAGAVTGKVSAIALAKKGAVIGVVGAVKNTVAAAGDAKIAAVKSVIDAKKAVAAGVVNKVDSLKNSVIAGVKSKVDAVGAAGAAAVGAVKDAVAVPIKLVGDVVQKKIDFANKKLAGVGHLIGLKDKSEEEHEQEHDQEQEHEQEQQHVPTGDHEYYNSEIDSGKSLSFLPNFLSFPSQQSNDVRDGQAQDGPVYEFIPDFGFSQYNRVRYAPNVGIDIPIHSSQNIHNH